MEARRQNLTRNSESAISHSADHDLSEHILTRPGHLLTAEYDSYVPDEEYQPPVAHQPAGYPIQQSMFTLPSDVPYPSAANPHPAFPSSYPSHSNPTSFTNMHNTFTDANGVTRTFAADAPAQAMHVEESASQFAGYARSHGFQPTSVEQYGVYFRA